MTKAYSYIRMSTDKQLHGDSLRRQTERAMEFAEKNGLILDDTFRLNDIGLSGYDGSHLLKGRLGLFLEAVKRGEVEPGSYLIIESFDRLSRQQPQEALRTFLDILGRGISIATLMDGRVYRPKAVDPLDLMLSLTTMIRAHEESATKADRGAAAWRNKRKNARLKILTKLCPKWLEPLPDRRGFKVILKRAEIVRRIFSFAADEGMGACTIAATLNREKVPPFGHAEGWRDSTIKKILTGRAVLGEYQPHTKVAGRRSPIEEPIEDYYPRVVDDDLYYRAQQAIASRRVRGGGRRGEKVSNLFSKLLRCGYCGGKMYYADKGKKGGPIIRCERATRRLDCVCINWHYKHFETAVLSFLRELDLTSITSEAVNRSELADISRRSREVRGRLVDAEKLRERKFALAVDSEPSPYLKEQFKLADQAVADLEAQLRQVEEEENRLRSRHFSFESGKVEAAAILERIQAKEGDDAFRIRSALSARLQDIVEKIEVFPGGSRVSPSAERSLVALLTHPSSAIPADDVEDYLKEHARARPERRSFFIHFKDGSFRFVQPHAKDPTRFEIISSSSHLPVTDVEVREMAATMGFSPDDPADYRMLLDAIVNAKRLSNQRGLIRS